MDSFIARLIELKVCEETIEFISSFHSPQEFWDTCKDVEVMLHLLRRAKDVDLNCVRSIALECAELVLDRMPGASRSCISDLVLSRTKKFDTVAELMVDLNSDDTEVDLDDVRRRACASLYTADSCSRDAANVCYYTTAAWAAEDAADVCFFTAMSASFLPSHEVVSLVKKYIPTIPSF